MGEIEKVIIIGAGVAGLFAGEMLHRAGVPFEILEATDSYGGRLAPLRDFAPYSMDLGAQWLHGERSALGDSARRQGVVLTEDPLEPTYWFEGALRERLPKKVDIFTGRGLPDMSFAAYAAKKGLPASYAHIITALAADLGGSADRISVGAMNEEEKGWSSGTRDYKFAESFFYFIDQQISEEVKAAIRYGRPVREIHYGRNGVTAVDTLGNRYTADKVIVTVSIAVLKSGMMHFDPPLPAEKVAAFDKIGMEAGMKVFLAFKEKFYPAYVVGGPVCAAYIDDSTGKPEGPPVLLAYLIGEQAERLSALGNEEAITRALLEELDTMFMGQASENFVKSYVKDWGKAPYVLGAYSYSTVGIGNARVLAAAPVEDKIYFAGEAMQLNGHHQTVHGAMERAVEVVDEVVKKITRTGPE
ncbi:amine oxidase [Nitritalea halalkaliphila LW7]|uniref:Tryptophan 2-monooxygenase n=1 Tax=Nitritalea halalkaliphila LW7 TaxID=1189621 RepID=I5CA41_9BACT|nr:NAD(P)/FAD-dependent oxidoreductase [Nitritalea halalkaliphila]EIM78693.1 amine oxidase [Nitritalea halalkaliphila LW7]